MLTTIPTVAGLNFNFESKCEITDVVARTTVRGIILFPRISQDGKTINFLAIRISFRTIRPDGIIHGIEKLHRFQIPKNFNGYLGKYFIYGSFMGCLEI
jgi:hypothetical protein